MIKLLKAIRLAVLAILVSGSVARAAYWKISYASYGGVKFSGGHGRWHGRVVTNEVKDLISKRKKFTDNMTMNKLFGGDPGPGVRKELTITLVGPGGKSYYEKFQENEMAKLQKWVLELN